MKKLLLLCLLLFYAAANYAVTLRVEQMQASDFAVQVQKIGKLIINGTSLEFYDRQGTLLYSTDMATIGVLAFNDDDGVTAVETFFDNDKYIVYPNPTYSSLIVRGVESSIPLRLYSTDGLLIKTVVGNTMNMEDVPAGTYLLQCDNQIVKIIKQ